MAKFSGGGTPALHLWDSPWFLLLVAQLELLLGVFLLFGLGGMLTWAAAVICFSVFLVVALVMAVLGVQDCGCFGPVKVSPWYTVILDLTCLAALFAVRSSWTASSPAVQAAPSLRSIGPFSLFSVWESARASFVAATSLRPRYVAVLGAVAASFVMFAAGAGKLATNQRQLSATSGVVELDGTVFLDPQQWVGRPFPLLDEIVTDEPLALDRGKWLTIFYRDSCPACKDALSDFRDALQAENSSQDGLKVLLIRVPPFDEASEAEVAALLAAIQSSVDHFILGQLSQGRNWFVPVPLRLDIDHGVVSVVSVR